MIRRIDDIRYEDNENSNDCEDNEARVDVIRLLR